MRQNKAILFSVTLQIIGGLFCILFTSSIEVTLPYIIGGMLMFIGLVRVVKVLNNLKRIAIDYSILSKSIIIIILGSFIIINKENSITFIAVIWGIFGLNNASESFETFFLKKREQKTISLRLFLGCFELFLSITLIFHPFEKIEFHIFLLGLELIVDAFKQMVIDIEI